MSIFRPTSTFTRLSNHTWIPLSSHSQFVRPFSQASCSLAQGYGDGKGDPKGENPQQQGSNTTAHNNAEHPGPAPPTIGNNTSGATTARSGSTKDASDMSASLGGSRSKEAKETGSSPTGGEAGGRGGESTSQTTSNGAEPKITDMKTPKAEDESKQAEVEQHNREFEQRYDRAPKAEDDKVDKKFWSGHGGKDREP